MEFVFAQLLTDLVREAEASQTPDNLFVLPEGILAWKRLFKLLQDEHEIVSMEVSDARQERSREVRPHFNRMARTFEDKGIPFIRVPITSSYTHRELRSDLGGIEYAPTILNLSFLEEGKLTIQKYEGFQEIVVAFNTGKYRRTLEEWVEKKIRRKVAEKMAEGVAGAFVEAAKEREDRLRREYEEKLRQQREELRQKERQVVAEREKRELEERRHKNAEEQRKEEEKRRKDEESMRRERELGEIRERNIAKLKQMDLQTAPVKDMKGLMNEMGVSTAGLLNRADYLERLYSTFPFLQRRRTESGGSSQSGEKDYFIPSAGLSVAQRIRSANLHQMTYGELKNLAVDADFDASTFSSTAEMIRALQRFAAEQDENKKITESTDGDPLKYQKLEGEIRSLRGQVAEKDQEIRKLKIEVRDLAVDLDVEKRRSTVQPRAQTRTTPVPMPRPQAGPGRSRTSSTNGMSTEEKLRQSEMERVRIERDLFDMRILYSTTMEDYNVMELVAQGDDGVVLKVTCKRPTLTQPGRVYAMKGLINYHNAKTMSRVRDQFRCEYEVLCKLPLHENVIKLHAFFFDRFEPSVHPSLKDLPGARSVSLFLIMDYHPTSVETKVQQLFNQQGPQAREVMNWFLQILAALEFLNSHCVVHRDLKLGNLMLTVDDVIKVTDFGQAVQLDKDMRMPFVAGMHWQGNEGHQSPEILNARPGPNRFLHYRTFSVWAAGVLAFELAGCVSPFYNGQVDQQGYSTAELPRLTCTRSRDHLQASRLPPRFTDLVNRMLEYNWEKRVDIRRAHDEMDAIVFDA